MARLLTLLLVVFTTLAETGVGNKEERQGWSGALLALAPVWGTYFIAKRTT